MTLRQALLAALVVIAIWWGSEAILWVIVFHRAMRAGDNVRRVGDLVGVRAALV